MTNFYLALILAVSLLFVYPTGRGQRIEGVSWFDIVHEMRGTSKKARGRIQQKRKRR